MKNKFIENMIHVFGASILSILTGLVSGFLLPKFLDINNYAYYKLFSFYCGYVGILHFGLIDGIFVKFGNYDYNELPKKKFRALLKLFLIMQIGLSILLFGGLLLLGGDYNRIFVIGLVIFNVTIINCNNYFTFINQFTKRFKLDSKIKIIQSILFLLSICILIIMNYEYYKLFIIMQTICYLITLVLNIKANKEIVFGISDRLLSVKDEIKDCVKIGFFIMISQLMGEIILGIDRIFVDVLMPLKEFAIYSFSVSILGLIFTVISSLSKIVYPYLARNTKENLIIIYPVISIIIQVVTCFILVSYYFIDPIIKVYLPNYVSSIRIIAILFPTIMYKVQIGFIGGNYYKLFRFEKEYVLNNIVALVVSILTNIIFYICFKSVQSIAYASLMSFVIWMLYTNKFFRDKLELDKTNYIKISIFPLIISVVFIITSKYSWMGCLAYILSILLIGAIFYYKEIKQIINSRFILT